MSRNIVTSYLNARANYTIDTVWEGFPKRPPLDLSRGDSTLYTVLGRPSKLILNNRQEDGFRIPSDYSTRLLTGRNDNPGSLSGNSIAVVAPYTDFKWVRFGNGYKETYKLDGDAIVQFGFNPVEASYGLTQGIRTKILINMKDEVLDAAMVLAEIRGTATTASNLLLRLGRSMDAVRRRSPESFRYLMHGELGVDKRRLTQRFLKETAGIFLEWKYGIMPTIYDLEGATKALDLNATDTLFNHPPLLVARAKLQETNMVKGWHTVLDEPTNVYPQREADGRYPVVTTVSARADFTVSGEALRGLSQYGIGLGTVGTVLFDRTPFSFVLNMAFPIADLIKAWTGLAGVTPRGYSETYYHELKVPRTVIPCIINIYGNPHARTDVLVPAMKGKWFSRLGTNRAPFPLPFIKNPIKVSNISTVLALFTQLRDKPKRLEKIHGGDIGNL